MPRYFFHVKRGPVTILDQKGVELGNTADAVKEAARCAEKIVTEEALNGAPVTQGQIIVTDDNWLRLFECRPVARLGGTPNFWRRIFKVACAAIPLAALARVDSSRCAAAAARAIEVARSLSSRSAAVVSA